MHHKKTWTRGLETVFERPFLHRRGHCLPPCWIRDWRTAAAWLYGTGMPGNLRVKDEPMSGKKEKPFRYWKPADLASLSMDIWPWAWPLRQLFRARQVEWTQLSPQKIRGSKKSTYILNFSSCSASRIGYFKHLSAVLSELNFGAKCSNFQVVTSCSPKSYLMHIGLSDLKTPIIGGYKLLRNWGFSSLTYTV